MLIFGAAANTMDPIPETSAPAATSFLAPYKSTSIPAGICINIYTLKYIAPMFAKVNEFRVNSFISSSLITPIANL